LEINCDDGTVKTAQTLPELEQDQEAFKTAQTFSGAGDNFAPALTEEPAVEEGQAEAVVEAALRPKRSLWRKMVTAGLALFGVSVVGQGVQWTMNAWQTQDWVALGGCAAGALIVGAASGRLPPSGVASGVCDSARMSVMKRGICHSHGTGKAARFVKNWPARRESISRIRRFSAGMPPSMKQNDREVVTLYSHMVQPVLDAQARRELAVLRRNPLMIAVSPLALVDMAFIAWRNLRLINRIANLYGIELGYYSRLRLFKLVLLNIAFAGASELVREVGWTGCRRIWRRVSARAAQGLVRVY
jgi:putative membrane protein